MSGWIKMHRKMTEWEWYDDHNTTRLFMHLIFTVNYKKTRWCGIELKPGQRICGRAKLSEETGLSVQQIRTCLDRLKSTNEITIKTTNRFSVLSIEKWEEYQDIESQSTSNLTSNLTNKQPTDNQQITTSKEYKKERSKKNTTYSKKDDEPPPKNKSDLEKEFSHFWKFYPSHKRAKGSKKDASKAFTAARKKTTFEKIMEGVKSYETYIRSVDNPNKDAFRWLQKYGWDDDYTVTTTSSGIAPYSSNASGKSKYQRILEAAARGHAAIPEF